MTTSIGAIIAFIIIVLFTASSLTWMILALRNRNECGREESKFCISYGCSVIDSQCNFKSFRFDENNNKVCQPYLLEKSTANVKGAPPPVPNN